MFKNLLGKNNFLWILPHLKSRDSRIPGFGILFKNSNSGDLVQEVLLETKYKPTGKTGIWRQSVLISFYYVLKTIWENETILCRMMSVILPSSRTCVHVICRLCLLANPYHFTLTHRHMFVNDTITFPHVDYSLLCPLLYKTALTYVVCLFKYQSAKNMKTS
jgi:hypothetical protein